MRITANLLLAQSISLDDNESIVGETRVVTRGRKRGFALPTVLVASFVMLAILAVALQSAVATRQALITSRYDSYARAAGDSGVVMANACLVQSNNTVTWSTTSPLTPATDCNGDVVSGRSPYIHNDSTYRTTFSVGAVTVANGFNRINVTGTTQLIRASSGAVWRAYTSTNAASISYSATQTTSGAQQTCALVSGASWCWGLNNGYGKLGDGTTDDSLTPVQVIRQTGALLGKVDTEIDAGNGFACVVSSGEVYCWGRNDYGQLGRGTTNTTANPFPQRVGGALSSRTVTRITTGGNHACALTTANEMYCWGANDRGQLGNNSTTDSSVPVRVSTSGALGSRTITQISLNYAVDSTCIVAGGAALCWGSNDDGVLGLGSAGPAAQYLAPQLVAGALSGRTVTDIALASRRTTTDDAHVCAIANDRAYCWGANSMGQVGNNTTTNTNTPVAVNVSGVMAGRDLVSIGAGNAHSCALSTEPRVYCWGTNEQGQLGNGAGGGAGIYSAVPVAISVLPGALQGKTITRMDAGGNRGCVIASQSNYCWGLNTQGQIGDGTTNHALVPTPSQFLDDLRATFYY
jgi:alpha-tubulin suppressor-like RCC1 family protein